MKMKTTIITLWALLLTISGSAQLAPASPQCVPVLTFIDSDNRPSLPENLVFVFFSYPPAPCNPNCYIEGTRQVDSNAPDGAWEVIQPTFTARAYRQEPNGAWFIGPRQRYVIIDMSEPQPIWFVRPKCFP